MIQLKSGKTASLALAFALLAGLLVQSAGWAVSGRVSGDARSGGAAAMMIAAGFQGTAGGLEALRQYLDIPLIVLDAGHGGTAFGTVYEGDREKDINLSITQKIQALLLDQGYRVAMTREDDRYMGLYERAEYANQLGADAFVSVHCNGSDYRGAYGIYTCYGEDGTEGERLAEYVQDGMIAATGAYDRGLYARPDYVVVREPRMPSVLVEVGFMSNHAELLLLRDGGYQDKLAEGIAAGIARYLDSAEQSLPAAQNRRDM